MFGEGHIYEALLKTVYEHDHYLVRDFRDLQGHSR